MQFARENIVLEGYLQQQRAPHPRFPEDCIWRGSANIAFSQEFIKWQTDGSPAVLISSIFVHGLPSVTAYYTVTAESACVVSELHKTHFTNKQLYFASAPVQDPYPVLQTRNSFTIPVSLSSPQPTFHLVVDVSPVYFNLTSSTTTAAEGEAEGEPEYARMCKLAPTLPYPPLVTLPVFKACVSFLRVSSHK